MRSYVRRLAPFALVTACGTGPASVVAEHTAQSGSALVMQQILTAPDMAAGAHVGAAVDIDGDTALVGADTLQGSAHVFVRSGSTWTMQAALTPDFNAWAGFSVAVRGDTAVLGGNQGRGFV